MFFFFLFFSVFEVIKRALHKTRGEIFCKIFICVLDAKLFFEPNLGRIAVSYRAQPNISNIPKILFVIKTHCVR